MRRPRATGLLHRTHVLVIAIVGVVALLVAWVSCSGPMPDDTPRSDPGQIAPDGTAGGEDVGRTRVTAAPTPGGDYTDENGEPLHEVAVRARLPGAVPVPGVTVSLHEREDFFNRVGEELTWQVTDAAGKVTFLVSPGIYDVRARHSRYRAPAFRIDVDRNDSWTLACGPGLPMRVRVIDEDDAPIEGASVWERNHGQPVLTGADGWADVGAMPAVNPYVFVTASGYSMERNYVSKTDDGTGFSDVFRLARGGALLVKIREEDGSFVPFADITVYEANGTMRFSSRANDVGEVVLDGVQRAEPFKVRAEARDGRRRDVDCVPGAEPAFTRVITLPRGRTLHGTVVHGWTGDSVPDAAVFGVRDSEWQEIGRSDAEGRFTLERVAGDVGAETELMAYAAGLGPDDDGWGADVTPSEGEVRLVVFPTMTVSGRVVDASGEPIDGAEVWISNPSEQTPVAPDVLRTRSEPDGSFVLGDLPPIENLVVVAEHPEHGTGWQPEYLEPTPDARIVVPDIELGGRFRLSAKVVDEDGTAVPEGRVWIRWRLRTRGQSAAYRDVVDGVMDPVDIPRRSASVEIDGPGLIKTVMRVDATTTEIVASLPCRAIGRVIRASGEPVEAGLWVVLESKDRLHTMPGNHGGGQTDAAGRFVAEGLRRGRYRLSVEFEDGTKWQTEVDVPAADTALGDLLVE